MCHKAKDTSFYLPVDASDWIMLSNQISDIVIIALLYSYCEGIFDQQISLISEIIA